MMKQQYLLIITEVLLESHILISYDKVHLKPHGDGIVSALVLTSAYLNSMIIIKLLFTLCFAIYKS